MNMYINPISSGKASEDEYNDCTVRALANAGKFEYEEAHSLLKSSGRKNRKGAFVNQWGPAFLASGFKLEGVFGTTQAARYHARELAKCTTVSCYSGMTLKRFITGNLKGSFICVNRNHAFAVVNGKLIDSGSILENTRISCIFKKK